MAPTKTPEAPGQAESLPQFPVEALPEPLRQWVAAESRATQTPADLAGLLALAVCAAAIARRVEVEPRPGWREPVNLFVAVLLEPGNRKSAVFTDATRPLRELETELIEAARPEVARAQSERRQTEARLKKLEKLAAEKHDAAARQEAAELAAELATLPEPVLPRLIADDATGEKLGMMLAEQGGRMASMSPEGGVFDLMAGLYSKNGAPQFDLYLKGHAGDDLRTDRVSRESVSVARPALTCAYAVQPLVITRLGANPVFRGRGLLGRFLYAVPKSWIGQRTIAPAPVPQAVCESYTETVRALASVDGEIILRLTPDAAAAFQEWETEIEAMLADGGPMEALRDWGAKLAGATARLAAVLHCSEHGAEFDIEAGTVASAVLIARYLISHAQAVMAMMQPGSNNSSVGQLAALVEWITTHGGRTTSYELTRGPRLYRGDPAGAEADLMTLVKTGEGHWEPVPAGANGGRPTREFVLHQTGDGDETQAKPAQERGSSAVATRNGRHDDDFVEV